MELVVRVLCARRDVLAGSLDTSSDDGVDHGDVADYDCDEGFSACPTASLSGTVGAVLGNVSRLGEG